MNDQRPPIVIPPFLVFVTLLSVLVVFLIATVLWLWPKYNVYSARLAGEAILAKAQAEKQVLVTQADAEREAAIARAAAIAIVGQASKDFPEYRQQEYIGAFADAMRAGKISQIIYIPTEAGLPIMERRK